MRSSAIADTRSRSAIGAEAIRTGGRLAAGFRALACVIAFASVYMFAVRTVPGQQLDAATLAALPALNFPAWMRLYAIRDVLLGTVIVFVVIAGVAALVARRFRVVLVSGATLLAAGVLSLVLDHLPRPQFGSFGYPQNTFPSGHVTMSLVGLVAVCWLTPRTPRWMAPLAAAIVFVTASASLFSLAHRGSDLIGGALVAGFVVAAAECIASPLRRGSRISGPIALILVGASAIIGMLGTRIDEMTAALTAIAVLGSTLGVVVWVLGSASGDHAVRATGRRRRSPD